MKIILAILLLCTPVSAHEPTPCTHNYHTIDYDNQLKDEYDLAYICLNCGKMTDITPESTLKDRQTETVYSCNDCGYETKSVEQAEYHLNAGFHLNTIFGISKELRDINCDHDWWYREESEYTGSNHGIYDPYGYTMKKYRLCPKCNVKQIKRVIPEKTEWKTIAEIIDQ